jgi:hypothetical protein
MNNPQFPLDPRPKIRSEVNTLETIPAKANRWSILESYTATKRGNGAPKGLIREIYAVLERLAEVCATGAFTNFGRPARCTSIKCCLAFQDSSPLRM